jgi:hypothetical protein
MIDSSAGNRNPVPPIIHVIDGALGRLLYFPVGYQRGLLHSSEIGVGESVVGHELPRRSLAGAAARPPITDMVGAADGVLLNSIG